MRRRGRSKPPWRWTTLLVWTAVVLAVASLASPWATKHAEEDHIGPEDGFEARYRLAMLELYWEEKRTTPDGAETTVPRGEIYRYADTKADLALPVELADIAGTATILGGLLMVLAALVHGVRPGPRRRRVGAWSLVVATAWYAGASLLFLIAIGLHAAAWGAREVGPLVPWLGALLAAVAATTAIVAVLRIGLRPEQEPEGMPSLPGVD